MHVDMKWILGVLAVLMIIWASSGAIKNSKTKDQIVLKEPLLLEDSEGGYYDPYEVAPDEDYYGRLTPEKINERTEKGVPLSTSEIATELEYTQQDIEVVKEVVQKIEEDKRSSALKGKLYIQSAIADREAGEEYLEIKADDALESKVLVTGLIVKSLATGNRITIGKGTYLPHLGMVNAKEPVFLGGGDTLLITTGRSPIGTSFRLNKCTGFFEQYQDFTPGLPINCPAPIDEPLPPPPNALDETCTDYLASMPVCTIEPEANPEIALSYECRRHIEKNINYEKCVSLHKNEPDFYAKEWRMFLERDGFLWKGRRETLQLVDAEGKEIHSYSY